MMFSGDKENRNKINGGILGPNDVQFEELMNVSMTSSARKQKELIKQNNFLDDSSIKQFNSPGKNNYDKESFGKGENSLNLEDSPFFSPAEVAGLNKIEKNEISLALDEDI